MKYLPGTRREDITGQRFGRLIVVAPHGKRGSNFLWRAACDCGGERIAQAGNMKAGLTTSCGCLFREATTKANRTHGYTSGGANRPEYNIWKTMKRRCHAPKSSMFASYGGRGIAVCDRWRFGEDGKSGFECFIADMGDRPTDRHSIDRIDNDAGYSKGNCRWATYVENNGNRRDNTLVLWKGASATLLSVCKDLGLPIRPIRARLKAGWNLDDALTQPLQAVSGPRK